MAAGGFGRKVVPTASIGGGVSLGKAPAPAALSPEAEMAARRAAFLAEERARREREAEQPDRDDDEYAGTRSFGSDRRYGSDRRTGSGPQRSMALAYILWFFLGGFSAHRFYLGYTTSGAVQLLMRFLGLGLMFQSGPDVSSSILLGLMLSGVSAIWLLADLFIIPSMCRNPERPSRPNSAFA